MVVGKVNVAKFIENSQKKIEEGDALNELKEPLEKSLFIIKELCDRLAKNSTNSSIPPSGDPNRDKNKEREKRKSKGKKRRAGGQPGHKGVNLKPREKPDKIVDLEVDRETLPEGEYQNDGYDSAQVFDIEISVVVTEYRAEILIGRDGNRYVADFPVGINNAVQYGTTVKSLSVYLSAFQLIPLDRVCDFFKDQIGLPISKGSINNFKREAEKKLKSIEFKGWAKNKILSSPVANADESGVNVDGEGHWLHSLSAGNVVLYDADRKRGKEAMDKMGVLPHFKGILCHDHWKPYYSYPCVHALCNAHHQRELKFAHEQDGQEWANEMMGLLEEIRREVAAAPMAHLTPEECMAYGARYLKILEKGKTECPLPTKPKKKRKGRPKKSKSRNLLERLLDYSEDTLRFMRVAEVPYTNNIAEGDIRMAKLYTNVSKCFRSIEGAKRFCLLRSYIITARKHGMDATDALRCLFSGEIPFFMRE